MRDQGPLSPIPYPIRYFVGLIVHSKILRTMHGQGTGRYTPAELAELQEEAWGSLNEMVGENSWVLGGEKPTEADACLYGFLASSMTSPA